MSISEAQLEALQQNSLNFFLQNFLVYLKAREKTLKKNVVKKKPTTPPFDSNFYYKNYKKNVDNRLREINDNVSSIITESCGKIDELCNKVRECLRDVQCSCAEFNAGYLANTPPIYMYDNDMNSLADDLTLHEIEEIKEDYEPKEDDDNALQAQNLKHIPPFFTLATDNRARTCSLTTNCKPSIESTQENQVLKSDNLDDSNVDEDDILNDERINKILESIHKDIESLSATTPKELDTIPEKQKHLSELKYDSEDKSTDIDTDKSIVTSKLELQSNLNSLTYHSDIIPDVYRRPGVTDIYKRLLVQIEANDSFICFQKLMNMHNRKAAEIKQPSKSNTIQEKKHISTYQEKRPHSSHQEKRPHSSHQEKRVNIPSTKSMPIRSSDITIGKRDLRSKYRNSLWFCNGLNKHLKDGTRRYHKMNTKSLSKMTAKSVLKVSEKSMSSLSFLSNYSNYLLHHDAKKCKSSISSLKHRLGRKLPKDIADLKALCGVACQGRPCPIQIKVHNEVPSNDKYRYQWMYNRHLEAPIRKLKCLDILDDLTHKDVLPLKSAYPRKDFIINEPLANYDDKVKPVRGSYLYKLMVHAPESTWDELFQPDIKCSNEHCNICEEHKIRKSKLDLDKHQLTALEPNLRESVHRRNIIQKLKPYMFDPVNENKKDIILTVLPVQVHYDKFPATHSTVASSKPSFSQKLSIITMKESNMASRAKWSEPRSSTGSLEKWDSNVKMPCSGLIRKPKPIKPKEEKFIKPQPIKKIVVSKEWNSKSFVQAASVIQRQLRHSMQPSPIRNFKNEDKDKEKDKERDKDKFYKLGLAKYKDLLSHSQPPTFTKEDVSIEEEIKEQAKQTRIIQGRDRSLWGKKYRKGTGKQLIDYVEHKSPAIDPPLPKYAMPKQTQPSLHNIKVQLQTKPIVIQKNDHQKKMLEHLKELKEKNCVIQNNIEKAISVIEAKMTDIISQPNSIKSTDAFESMEKEITNVLSLMKCSSGKQSRNSTPAKTDRQETEEDFDSISNQLFQKLEKILDSEKSKCSASSSQSNIDIEHKPTIPCDMQINASNINKDMHKNQISSCSALDFYSTKEGNSILQCGDQKIIDTSNLSNKNNLQNNLIIKEQCGDQNVLGVTENQITKKSEKNYEEIKAEDNRNHTENEMNIENKMKFEQPIDITNQLDIKDNKLNVGDNINESKINIENKINERDAKISENQMSIEMNINTKTEIDKDQQNDYSLMQNKPDHQEKHMQSVYNYEEPVSIKTDGSKKQSIHCEERSVLTLPSDLTTQQSNDEKSRGEISSLSIAPNKVEVKTETPRFFEASVGNSYFPEQVNKIIKRVEDIYKELDDIHVDNSQENVRVFQEVSSIVNIESNEFLTPFMQAVCNKRKNVDEVRPQSPRKSPSYYNILHFLDSLNNMQRDEVREIYTARLCSIPLVTNAAEIFDQFTIQHTLHLDYDKPSCLKKKSTDDCKTKPKKVSFSVLKEDKFVQAEICPYHKLKQLKVSNHQFPPLEPSGYKDQETTIENDDLDSIKDVSFHKKLSSTGAVEHILNNIQKSDLNQSMESSFSQTEQPDIKATDSEEIHCENADSQNNLWESLTDSSSCVHYFTEGDPQIQVYYEDSTDEIPKVIVKNEISESVHDENSMAKARETVIMGSKKKPKIVLFREIADVTDILKPLKNLEKLDNVSIIKKENHLMNKNSSKDRALEEDHTNTIFLKSFYAAIYIVMFTALNMQYACIHS